MVAVEHLNRSVEAQSRVEDSILDFYRQIIALRKSLPELVKGDFEFVTHSGDVVAFWRKHEGRAIFCAFNLCGESRELPLPKGEYAEIAAPFTAKAGAGKLTLPPHQAWFAAQAR